MAADLSTRQGWIDADLYARIVALLQQAKLPIDPPAVRLCLHCMPVLALTPCCKDPYNRETSVCFHTPCVFAQRAV